MWLLLAPLCAVGYYPTDFDKPLERIALGSCNRAELPQPLWPAIQAAEPDLWVWLGDNIYADTEDMARMARMYEQQKANEGYAKLRAEVPVVGIWDDHDYGENNSGNWYPQREGSQRNLLDFLDEPEDSQRRQSPGIYASYTFGPVGKRAKLILLDTRYFADRPGAEADILGEAQWKWLDGQLRGSEAQVHLIASGIQVIPEDHPFEKWANFPKSRERLVGLIARHGTPGVVFISGDRHLHEISLYHGESLPYPVPELTSSGLTHSWDTREAEKNRHRVAPLYNQLGFGVIEIAWDGPHPHVSLQVRDAEGATVRRFDLPLASLRPLKDLGAE